ncbi:hypothetical protein Phou_103810 [Phytohabitans houttuyneae]|uniref:Uncharacterized protein n=1 Tax=Phytohabitans houttuyneae TaxID=1076126 RepID=A0A6V8KUZ1_9ACTN|nr:hypothetical protein Phou_103810 [Phytohabitans houttuyneae]
MAERVAGVHGGERRADRLAAQPEAGAGVAQEPAVPVGDAVEGEAADGDRDGASAGDQHRAVGAGRAGRVGHEGVADQVERARQAGVGPRAVERGAARRVGQEAGHAGEADRAGSYPRGVYGAECRGECLRQLGRRRHGAVRCGVAAARGAGADPVAGEGGDQGAG